MRRSEPSYTLCAHFVLLGIVATAAAIPWTALKLLAAQEGSDPSRQRSAGGQSAVHAGKQAFESSCGACHGLDARGGQHGPGIVGNPDVQPRARGGDTKRHTDKRHAVFWVSQRPPDRDYRRLPAPARERLS